MTNTKNKGSAMEKQDGYKTFTAIFLLALLTTAFCVMIIISRAICGTDEDRAPQSTSQATSTQQQAGRTEQTITPSETQQAQPQSPVEQEIGYKGYIAHVDENGDVTWTDPSGNTVPTVDWEIVRNYPFTQEELVRIQQGFDELAQEAEAEADASVEAEPGQSTPEATSNPSDADIPGTLQYYEEQASLGGDMRSYWRKPRPGNSIPW